VALGWAVPCISSERIIKEWLNIVLGPYMSTSYSNKQRHAVCRLKAFGGNGDGDADIGVLTATKQVLTFVRGLERS
jgi:hypothetical protein